MRYQKLDDMPFPLDALKVSKVLGISRSGAYNLMRSESFPSFRIGSRLVVMSDRFSVWLEAQQGKNGTEA